MSGLTHWVRSKLYGPKQPPDDTPYVELAKSARKLNGSLQTYLEKPDPLAALMRDLRAHGKVPTKTYKGAKSRKTKGKKK